MAATRLFGNLSSKKWDYLCLLVISIIPVLEMGLSGYWNKSDLDFPLNPIELFQKSIYVWDPSIVGGNAISTRTLYSLDSYGFWALLYTLGLTVPLIQRLYLAILLFGSSASMYYLVSTITPFQDSLARRGGSVVSAIAYTYSSFVLVNFHGGQDLLLTAHSVLPFSFVILHKGLRRTRNGGRGWFKYSVLLALTSQLLLTTNYVLDFPAIIMLLSFVLAFVVAGVVRRELSCISRVFSFSAVTLALALLINLFWIGPLIQLLGFTNREFLSSALQSNLIQAKYAMDGARAHILSTIRLNDFQGSWVYQEPLYWEDWIQSPVLNLLGACLVGLSITFGMIRRRWITLWFAVVLLLSIGLLSSVDPFYSIRLYLIENFRFTALLDRPETITYIGIFSFAVLLGMSFGNIVNRLSRARFGQKRVLGFCILALMIGSVIALNYPFAAAGSDGPLRTGIVPSYYYQAQKWLNDQQGNFRIFAVPYTIGYESYTWDPTYLQGSILHNLFDKPVVDEKLLWHSGAPEVAFMRKVNQSIGSNATSLPLLLNFLNIKYILVRADVAEPPANVSLIPNARNVDFKLSEVAYHNILNSRKDFRLAATFGNFSFYQNLDYTDRYIYPADIVYPASVASVSGTTEFLMDHGVPMARVSFYDTQQRNTGNLSSVLPTLPPGKPRLLFDFNSSDSSRQHPDDSIVAYNYSPLVGNYVSLRPTESAFTVSHGVFGIDYDFHDHPQNWNPYVKIGLQVMVNNSDVQKFELSIEDTKGQLRHWDLQSQISAADTWTKITLSQLNYTGGDTSFDLSNIKLVRLWALGASLEVNLANLIGMPFTSLPESGRSILGFNYKINDPTSLSVRFNSNGSSLLVFSQTYDPSWIATTSDGKTLQHVEVNLYANGWVIPEAGNYTIHIQFTPQDMRWLGIFVSAVSTVGAIAYLSVAALSQTASNRSGWSSRVRRRYVRPDEPPS